jgi:formylglycine-generating enzyme required for sulfatase activity
MTLVCVPEGNFWMGDDSDKYIDNPLHRVFLDAYWIDKTEVTNGMYSNQLGQKSHTRQDRSNFQIEAW